MSELVKAAVSEAETFGNKGGQSDVPAKVQLGRAAQASLQVSPAACCLLHWSYCSTLERSCMLQSTEWRS